MQLNKYVQEYLDSNTIYTSDTGLKYYLKYPGVDTSINEQNAIGLLVDGAIDHLQGYGERFEGVDAARVVYAYFKCLDDSFTFDLFTVIHKRNRADDYTQHLAFDVAFKIAALLVLTEGLEIRRYDWLESTHGGANVFEKATGKVIARKISRQLAQEIVNNLNN